MDGSVFGGWDRLIEEDQGEMEQRKPERQPGAAGALFGL